MNKLLVICGPTATGKTQFAIKLAKKFNGEIISADSRQVYIGMDIATGKDRRMYGDVPVHMIDVVDPRENFSVAQYSVLANKAIEDIWNSGKLPILVGGTGLYIKAIVDGIETSIVPPDEKLRKDYANKGASELFHILNKINPQKANSMNESDRKNPRRLIRAIEISNWKEEGKDENRKIDVIMIGLTAPREILYQLIDARVDKRMSEGMVGEVDQLLGNGVSHKRMQSFGLEYRLIDNYLTGKITEDILVETLKYKIHDFARRQLTWFKKDKRINWSNIESSDWAENVEKKVRAWYNDAV